MKCPACGTHLSIGPELPGGLAGSFVRVTCPVASCARPLVAWAYQDHELELMSLEDGLEAARLHSARRHRPVPVMRILMSLAAGAVLTLLRMRAHPADAVRALLAGAAAALLFFAGLAWLRRRRAARDARLLLDELPELPRALEPTAQGYRR